MPIIWESKLDTGIDVIDHQHRRIVDYINDLEIAKAMGDKKKVTDVIEQLIDYTQSHFGFEESMMEEAGYKFLKPHKKVHELFIKRVTDFTMRGIMHLRRLGEPPAWFDSARTFPPGIQHVIHGFKLWKLAYGG